MFISAIKIMLLWCLVKALQVRSEQSMSQDRVSRSVMSAFVSAVQLCGFLPVSLDVSSKYHPSNLSMRGQMLVSCDGYI